MTQLTSSRPVSLLLGLHAETSLHPGAGAALGVIDLPIQREAPTDYPVIFASSVKGALRAAFAAIDTEGSDTQALFGPAPGNVRGDSAFAGALLVGDARLLALPLRSLTTHFKWVTCPYLIERLRRDVSRLCANLGGSGTTLDIPSSWRIECGTLAAHQGADKIFLEEYCFSAKAEPNVEKLATAFQAITGVGLEALRRQLVVVGDDDFSHLMRAATPVTPHVALESDTKTVRRGALWYEETLPPETLLYIPLVANAVRQRDVAVSASDCAGKIAGMFERRAYLQLGGNETVGMGWCHVCVTKGGVA